MAMMMMLYKLQSNQQKNSWSLHPTTTNKEVIYFAESIKEIVANFDEWKKEYEYSSKTNEFHYVGPNKVKKEVIIDKLFKL